MVQDILSKYDEYINRMSSYMDSHFVGGETRIPDNVPETVNPVKARLAYVQVPDGDITHLDGTRLPSLPTLTRLSLLSIGLPVPMLPLPRRTRVPRPTTSSSGVSTIRGRQPYHRDGGPDFLPLEPRCKLFLDSTMLALRQSTTYM